jgi:hypothetical protein
MCFALANARAAHDRRHGADGADCDRRATWLSIHQLHLAARPTPCRAQKYGLGQRSVPRPSQSHPRPRRLQMLMKDSVPLGLVRPGFFVHGQIVNIVEPPSAELWPFLWPLGAALDALCTFGARSVGGIKRLLFASFSHFSGEPKKSRNRLTKPQLYSHV